MDISFRIDISPAAAAQSYALVGKFLYTVNGQSSEADCTPTNITITGGAAAQAGSAPQNSSTAQNSMPQNTGMPQASAPQNNSPVQPGTTQVTGSSLPNNSTSVSGGAFVVRQFSSTSVSPNNDATVTLTIHKANISGFAKIEDSIPPGFTANAVDTKGASFTFVDTRAKFVWDNLPTDSMFTISYRISAISSVPGTHIVVGNFSYLYNNTPYTISIGSSIFNSSVTAGYDINKEKNASAPPANNAVVASNPPPANTTPQPATVASSMNNNVTPVNNNTAPASSNSNATPQPDAGQAAVSASNAAATESGITYKVQILAMHNPVSTSYFSRKIKEHVSSESDAGLTKYTVGNYTDYNLVKQARDNLRGRGFDGAFVVTYRSGVRLSLEDAMKINH